MNMKDKEFKLKDKVLNYSRYGGTDLIPVPYVEEFIKLLKEMIEDNKYEVNQFYDSHYIDTDEINKEIDKLSGFEDER